MLCRNYAHRGFSGKYPENTLLSFQKAMEAGCEGIETDVQMTKDKKLVIIHDEDTERTSGRKGLVKDMTLGDISALDVSYKFKSLCGSQKIPSIDDFFDLVKDKDIIINLELKTGVYEYPGIEEAVYKKIKEYKMEDKIIISSFNHYSLKRFKTLAPFIKCGFLTDRKIEDAACYIRERKGSAYHPYFRLIDDETLKELKMQNIETNVWTVNEEKDILNMIDKKVEGIISNYPDKVRELLLKRGLR